MVCYIYAMENDKPTKKLSREQKEKKEIEMENKLINIILPATSLAAFLVGLVGFILSISVNVGAAIFLLFLALLGGGGVAYGVLLFLKWRRQKFFKEEEVPSDEPNDKPVQA